ncbi:hypothetical protein OSB04_017479 [Centaurea solstitialis]|uniref:Uncharacterized protein n=1 Tax=Centaurea solstitialis TaxID=347529 RepID=A0AA38T4L3_9ASTR|nr:hypothetical protein OSB04_017479 [Centaurea solstitialis]
MLLEERFKYANHECHIFQNSIRIASEILVLAISRWINWLSQASNSCKVTDVHLDRLFRKSENLITAELLKKDKDVKIQGSPRYLGIASNMFIERSRRRSLLLVNGNNQLCMDELRLLSLRLRNSVDEEEELISKEYGRMTSDRSHLDIRDSTPFTTIIIFDSPCRELAIRVFKASFEIKESMFLLTVALVIGNISSTSCDCSQLVAKRSDNKYILKA